jgi:hypothetical protein
VRTRSKRARAAKQAQAQLGTVKGRISPAVETATVTAHDKYAQVAERVGPTVLAARENVVPAVHTAVDTTREKLGPVVADARDRVVDDLLPRIAEAVSAASAAAIAARDNAIEQAQGAAAETAKNLPANKGKRRRRRFTFLLITFAAVGAGVAALKARSAKDDPWTPAAPSGAVNGATRLTPAPAPTPAPGPTENRLPTVDPDAPVDPLTDPLVEDPSVPVEDR